MTQMSAIPGNAVVGRLTEVAPWEADLIMSMRLWMENADGQRDVWNSYARCYGSAERNNNRKLRYSRAIRRLSLWYANA